MKRLNVLIGLMFMLLTADAQKFVWYGANGVSQVETGLGNVTGTQGIWFGYRDDGDGGASYVVWDSEMVDDIVTTPKYTGGISGTAVLDKGFLGYNPFVGVGFNIVGEAPRSSSDEYPPPPVSRRKRMGRTVHLLYERCRYVCRTRFGRYGC